MDQPEELGPNVVQSPLTGCACCGGDHKQITFLPFVRPKEIEGLTFTHWGTCPTTQDPILLRFQQVETS